METLSDRSHTPDYDISPVVFNLFMRATPPPPPPPDLRSFESISESLKYADSDVEQLAIKQGDNTYVCPICLECPKERDPVTTECRHIFCLECIYKVVRIHFQRKCPICRKVVYMRDLLRVAL